MIPFEEIDSRLAGIGKNRAWLSQESGRKSDSIRVALAPNAPASKRSKLLQKALSDAIEREEEKQSAAAPRHAVTAPELPVGYTAIYLQGEALDKAEQASRLVGSPSVNVFCHDLILAEAKRIIAAKDLTAQKNGKSA